MANSHKKHNKMEGLKIDGIWHREGNDLQQGIVNAFQTSLFDLGDWRANLEGLTFSKLKSQEAAILELPFLEEEVVHALHELNGEKASGPDGYTTAFWKFSWDTIKDEVMTAFKDFFSTGKFVKGLNSIFIVMVPKKEGVDDFKDFKPISLVGSKEQKIGYFGRYIAEISDISRYRHDFSNRKSVSQKIGKIADISTKYRKFSIFRRNIESISHTRMCWTFWKNISKI